jgi:hypothetical protein
VKHDLEAIRAGVAERLGDQVDEVRVVLNDHDYEIAVVIKIGCWRHAVTGETCDARRDPAGWADVASDKLLAAIARRAR